MHRALIALTVSALAVTGTSACATKKFVNNRVGEVDGKVTTLSGDLEKSQQRINEVDQKAGAAGDAAKAADARAAAAWRTACSCVAARSRARASALICAASASFRSAITTPAHTRASTTPSTVNQISPPRRRDMAVPPSSGPPPADPAWGEVWPPAGPGVRLSRKLP